MEENVKLNVAELVADPVCQAMACNDPAQTVLPEQIALIEQNLFKATVLFTVNRSLLLLEN